MNQMQKCVLPEECVCEVSGVRYWPGQQVKMGCEICRCERGRPRYCQANPECSGIHQTPPPPPHTNYRLLFNYSINISLSGSMTVFVFCVCMIFLVHCGWSSWSPWGECLGPCGVQSVQWSFRSPNNPSKHGSGRQCRGIYRKARR